VAMTFSSHRAQPGTLLDHPELEAHLGRYDPELLTYTWTAAERKTDRLQARLAALVGQSVAAGEPIATDVLGAPAAACEAAGRADGPARRPGARPVRLRREEAAAHRAVVLLSGAHPRASLALSRSRATGAA
jgi:hypothetical protein